MKLSTIAAGPHALMQHPHAHDIDAGANVMPSINRHVAGLRSLLALLPEADGMVAKLDELEGMLAARMAGGAAMIEMATQQPTIIDYDYKKPLGQQRAHIHGVGSAAVGYLPTKVIRESSFVGDVISEIDHMERDDHDYNDLLEKYQELNRWTQQLARTSNTLASAATEMARYRQTRPRSNTLETESENARAPSHMDHSIQKLEGRLLSLALNGSPLDYASIDGVMKQICQEDGCSEKDLHDSFKHKHHGMIPDEWVMKVGSNENLGDVAYRMYEELSSTIGEKAWPVVSNRLVTEGHDRKRVNRAINEAIIKNSKA